PYKGGNNESCSFTNPKAGTWHVQLSGFSAFSGVTLKASY
ncbi:MAG: PPC domain-containing protein, partial [Aeromonas veronii]